MLCSNPTCRAHTSGPQIDPEKIVNVGVGAHITAASQGGPRFDFSLSEKERRSVSNGVWLCQTCAKLVDSDQMLYTTALLKRWKADAEKEAQNRIGKTNKLLSNRALKKAEEDLKRNHKVRDELRRAFIKSTDQQRSLPVNAAQNRKFAETDFIVHRVDDTAYPGHDEGSGIEGILGLEYVLLAEHTQSWSSLPEDQRQGPFPKRFYVAKVFKTGRIPFRNIRHYDLRGDEYYNSPHLYCLYADDGMPYESFVYYVISDADTYHFPLASGRKVPLQELLEIHS